VKNHVSWKDAHDTVTTNEERVKFLIQDESGSDERVLRMYSRIWQYPYTKNMLMEFRNKVLERCIRIIKGLRQDALDGRKLVWEET